MRQCAYNHLIQTDSAAARRRVTVAPLSETAREARNGMNYRRLRDTLRRERTTARLSLDALAAKTGLNRATIHSLENVRREPNLKPDLETVDRIVRALDLTLPRFFELVETPEAPPRLSAQPVPSTNAAVPTGSAAGNEGGPISDARVHEAVLIAAVQNLSHTLNAAVDRLLTARARPAPEGEPRQQAAAPRRQSTVRARRHRKVG